MKITCKRVLLGRLIMVYAGERPPMSALENTGGVITSASAFCGKTGVRLLELLDMLIKKLVAVVKQHGKLFSYLNLKEKNVPATERPGRHDDSWRKHLDYSSRFVNRRPDSKIFREKGLRLAKPYRGMLPSKIIAGECRRYGVNPEVILTGLQVEQGLISKKRQLRGSLTGRRGVALTMEATGIKSSKVLKNRWQVPARHISGGIMKIVEKVCR